MSMAAIAKQIVADLTAHFDARLGTQMDAKVKDALAAFESGLEGRIKVLVEGVMAPSISKQMQDWVEESVAAALANFGKEFTERTTADLQGRMDTTMAAGLEKINIDVCVSVGAVVEEVFEPKLKAAVAAEIVDLKADHEALVAEHDATKLLLLEQTESLADSLKAVADNLDVATKTMLVVDDKVKELTDLQHADHVLLVDTMTDVSNAQNDTKNEIQKAVSSAVLASAGSFEELAKIEAVALEKRLTAMITERSAPGKDGRDGVDGKDGIDGENGRDALALEIMDGIDPSKSYPRNTYATHQGGLWRSFEKTKGMRGWDCVVNGIAGIDLAQGSTRDFKMAIKASNGDIVAEHLHVPGVEYQGMYSQKTAYVKGDLVTYAGSLWHCNEANDDEAPGTGEKWAVAAKRGRDGKTVVEAAKRTDGKHVTVKAV